MFVVSVLMDVSVGDTLAPLLSAQAQEVLFCVSTWVVGMLCRHSSSATSLPLHGLSFVKFETLKATINRDSFEFDTVVFSKLSDDLLIGASSDVPAAMLSFALSCDWAAWPAWFVAWPCHLLGCFQLFLPDALLAAC